MAKKSRLRGYEILEPVGAGAQSIIYRARELSSGRIVAVLSISMMRIRKHRGKGGSE